MNLANLAVFAVGVPSWMPPVLAVVLLVLGLFLILLVLIQRGKGGGLAGAFGGAGGSSAFGCARRHLYEDHHLRCRRLDLAHHDPHQNDAALRGVAGQCGRGPGEWKRSVGAGPEEAPPPLGQ